MQTARFVTPVLPRALLMQSTAHRYTALPEAEMAKGFTDIAIRNFKAGDVRREIPDPGASNLYLIIQPSGRKSFAVRYRHDGKPRKLTLPGGLTLKAARKLASDALYEVEQGNDPGQTKKEARAKIKAAKANTVQALCENYLRREGSKLRTAYERERELKRLVYPKIGDVPLADLKRSTIVKLLDEIEDENGTKMADLILAYLRRIFNWHVSRTDDFVSPVSRNMNRYDARANQGTRVLTDDELRAIWNATEPNEHAPQLFHALVRFLLLTGARRTEANEMTWAEIDGSVWTLPPSRNKTKVELVRPLSAAVQRVLETLPRTGGAGFVFSYGATPLHLSRPTAALKAAIGVTGWRLHDLRRTARTLMSAAGVDSDTAERCLGHSLPHMRSVYDKYGYESEMLKAFEALATQIDLIVNPRGGAVVPIKQKKGRATGEARASA